MTLLADNTCPLIEQSFGRRLRLAYGKRTGVDAPEDDVPSVSVAIKSNLEEIINGIEKAGYWVRVYPTGVAAAPIFDSVREKQVAQNMLQVLTQFQHKPDLAPAGRALFLL